MQGERMHIFFSVGEPSGDLHGANLIAELQRRNPTVRCSGFGGPRMQAAGCNLLTDMTQLAIMWFAAVLIHIRRFLSLLRDADRFFANEKPDAVILIDYPGFNWWVARRARKHNIPVFYYGTPQMWAWAGWRVRKLKRLVDHVLCKLPFEVDWFRERGCEAHYVGHPYFDELCDRTLDSDFLEGQRQAAGPLITILPGSRSQEVTGNLPHFLKAAQYIYRQRPHTRFAIASYNEEQAVLAQEILQKQGSTLQIEIYSERTPELIEAAVCCMACSGSVSLELLYHKRPAVVLYHISRLAYFVQNKVRTVRYITLANLLAEDQIFCRPGECQRYEPYARRELPFPEFITYDDAADEIAEPVLKWLTDPDKYATDCEHLSTLRSLYAQSGASKRAAEYVLNQLGHEETVAAPTRRAG